MEKRTVNENNNLFGKIVRILFIATMFFGLGYWSGKQNYTFRTVIDFLSSKKQKLKVSKPSKLEEITEKFTFHRSLTDKDEMLLPDKKVEEEKETKKGKEEKPTLKPFTLQLASFKKEDLAQDYIAKLNAVGLHPYIKKFDLKKEGVWYRVFLGEFAAKEDALEYANQNLKPMDIYFLAVEK